MNKEIIISKFNIKNYSNQLEKVLLKKPFSINIKNLLSDMLYKIENSYKDYKNVKKDVKTKNEMLEEIINIIENKCNNIETTNERVSKVIPKEGKIITYLNTEKMLYALYKIRENKFNINEEYYIIKKALEDTLNQGYNMDQSEIIRDFDGWSWNIQIDEMEDIINNFLYQVLKILVGNKFLDSWQKSSEDYILKLSEKLEKKYTLNNAEEMLKIINQISIINYTNNNKEEKENTIKITKELKKQFSEINNKKEYLKEILNTKKKINKQICDIDEIINSDKLLKEEFIKRNEKLNSKRRIFSLSDFVDILQDEKTRLMNELSSCNKKMEPLNYVKMKTEIENKLNLLEELILEENIEEILNKKIKRLIELVEDAIRIQVNNIKEDEEFINIICKIRYFKSIPILKDKKVQDFINFDNLENYVVTLACKKQTLNILSKNINKNFEIIKQILKLDIINLERIQVKFIEKNQKFILEVYEDNNKNAIIEFDKIEDLNVSKNKRIKLFVN